MSRSGLKLLIKWTGWPGTGVEIKGWVGIKKIICREKFQLLLNYCTNIICYMMFKAKVGSQLGFSFLVILAEIIYSESNSVGSGYALKKDVRIRTVTNGLET